MRRRRSGRETRGALPAAAAALEGAAARLRRAGHPPEEAGTALALGRVRRGLGDEAGARTASAAGLRILTRAAPRTGSPAPSAPGPST
jgi:hypothetical protein